ncbi:sugar phosphate isomerase/epimerase [Parabacteroides sp. OttesenSCG-928-G07]|nr:sugar phosphate isomerase/epimerase [Parabacteroides sp. OttesenSCG-928-G21]MDL2278383.1 sugar phosphate isomerase/epimerase [Parabacteroides sp. OttesenSCG-928-G07]
MQNRRDFLKQASLLAAGGMLAPQLLSSCGGGSSTAAAGSGKHIGLQLYSLREMVKDDGIEKVIEAVSKMGYTHVEAASYDNGLVYGMKPADFKKLVNDNGMKCTSAHVNQSYSKENEAEVMMWWDKCTEAHNELGVKYMVMPMLTINNNTTMDDMKNYCDYLTAIGLKTAAASIQFGYHNHAFEFETVIDGKMVYDIMLDTVSKNHVFFQMDVYWVMMGGQNPAKYLAERPSQFKAIHIKDEKEIGASGLMNYQPIFEQMKANNVKDWYVEVEQYTNNNPQESVKQSYDYLAKADYVY